MVGTRKRQADLYDDLPPTGVYLNNPQAVVLNADGDLYYSDTGNHRVRILGIKPPVMTENYLTQWFELRVDAALYQNVDEPHAIVFDSYGNLVASSSSTIKLVEPNANGVVTGLVDFRDLSAKRGL